MGKMKCGSRCDCRDVWLTAFCVSEMHLDRREQRYNSIEHMTFIEDASSWPGLFKCSFDLETTLFLILS